MKRPDKTQEKFDFFLIGLVSLPEFNLRFHTVAAGLRRQGFSVASPIESAPDSAPDFAAMLRHSLPLLCASSRVVLLSDHTKCSLARLLVYLAQRLELEFLDVSTMAPMPQMRLAINFVQAAGGDPRRARQLVRELQNDLDAEDR